MFFFCGFDILNTICYASFEHRDSFIPQISLGFLGWELWEATVDFLTEKILWVLRLWALWTFFTDREGVGADLEYLLTFSQQSSAAFPSSTTKIPLLFQCFQPRSQSSCSGQQHSLFQLQAWDGRGWEPATVSLLCQGLEFRTFLFTACKFILTSASPQNMSRMTFHSFFFFLIGK